MSERFTVKDVQEALTEFGEKKGLDVMPLEFHFKPPVGSLWLNESGGRYKIIQFVSSGMSTRDYYNGTYYSPAELHRMIRFAIHAGIENMNLRRKPEIGDVIYIDQGKTDRVQGVAGWCTENEAWDVEAVSGEIFVIRRLPWMDHMEKTKVWFAYTPIEECK